MSTHTTFADIARLEAESRRLKTLADIGQCTLDLHEHDGRLTAATQAAEHWSTLRELRAARDRARAALDAAIRAHLAAQQ